MKRLIPIVQQLSRKDMFALKAALRAQGKTSENKRLKLLEAIRQGKIQSEEEAFQWFNNKETFSPSAFSNLKKRLRSTIEQVFVMQMQSEDVNGETVSKQKCLEYYTTANAFVWKGMTEEALICFEKSYQLAKTLDWKSKVILIAEEMEAIGGSLQGSELSQEINQSQHILRNRGWVNAIEECRFKLGSTEEMALKETIGESQLAIAQCTSPRLALSHYRMAFNYHLAQRENEAALSMAMNQMHIVEAQPKLFTKLTTATVYLNVARACAGVGHQKTCVDYGMKMVAISLNIKKGGFRLLAQAIALFLQKQLETLAIESLNKALQKGMVFLDEDEEVHFRELEMVRLLITNQPKKIANSLRKLRIDHSPIDRFNFKCYELTAALLCNDFDLAEHRLNALKQWVNREANTVNFDLSLVKEYQCLVAKGNWLTYLKKKDCTLLTQLPYLPLPSSVWQFVCIQKSRVTAYTLHEV